MTETRSPPLTVLRRCERRRSSLQGQRLRAVPNHDADGFRRLVSQAVSVDLEIAFEEPPPPLVVNIQGTRSAPLNEWCTWTAQVSGGTEPYQFAWRRDDELVSSQPNYNGFTGTMGFQLEVDVSDAETQSASRSIVVSVSGGGGC